MDGRHFWAPLLWVTALSCLWGGPALAQPEPLTPPAVSVPAANGAEGPAAAGLNRTFRVGAVWAMYGAPQPGPLSREAFEALAGTIEETRFAAENVQVVVIVREADASGTLGLVEKRGRKFSRLFVTPEGPTPFDIWRQVGYRVTPERILADYRENVLAAEELYRDLPLRFTGLVRRVARDARGEVFVDFALRRTDLTLACYPWAKAPQAVELKDLKSGLRLDVAGQFAEYNQAGLKLHSCLFSPPQ
ncbi:hypothetical protein FACS189460_4300 [Deltaproteobacteria bacterium]|nr:hypothetical protein FACS189460_4300 [Deltaproteobacteria bacterium]